MHDRSRYFAHECCSSLVLIQPVDWITRGRNALFVGWLSMWWPPFAAFWSALAPQDCTPWVSGWLYLVQGWGGRMHWKERKVSLQTPWAAPWNFPWILGALRWNLTAYWCLQETWGMCLWYTRGVHWWTIFCPHQAALPPIMSIPSRRCGRLYPDLLICTSSFWWSWGKWQEVGRGDHHSTPHCGPGLWLSGLKYFWKNVFL